MTYFIKRHDIPFDPMDANCILGNASLKKFWYEQGYHYLTWLGEAATDEMLLQTEIFDDQGEKYTINEFLDKISKLYFP